MVTKEQTTTSEDQITRGFDGILRKAQEDIVAIFRERLAAKDAIAARWEQEDIAAGRKSPQATSEPMGEEG